MTDDRDDGGSAGERHGLVRPYVLGSGSSARGGPADRDGRDSLARGRQPMPDWPPRHDIPSGPRPATEPPPGPRFAGGRRAGPRLLAERRWLAAVGAAAVALVIAGGAIVSLSSSPVKPQAHGCQADCRRAVARTPGGTNPAAGAPAPKRKATRSHPTVTHSTVRPTHTPSATPTPKRTPTPTASPAPLSVKVSYAVVDQHPHSFQSKFTIVNTGSTAINGWELVVVLPGDDIRSVWSGLFHTNGDTLFIDPSQSQRSIAPGATVTENLTAHGSTTTLTSCTFNGSPC